MSFYNIRVMNSLAVLLN